MKLRSLLSRLKKLLNVNQKKNYEMDNNAKSYPERRKNLVYYKYLRSLLLVICREEDSICDVGSNGVDMLSFLPCKTKKSIDLRKPYCDSDTEGIIGDYLEWETERLSVITCFQVLEHIDDDHVVAFARKLLRDGRVCVASVPYVWAEDQCERHLQDPVDLDKLVSWFGKNPVFLHRVVEPSSQLSRLIAVFIEGVDPEIDFEYWRNDAKKAARHVLNKWLK